MKNLLKVLTVVSMLSTVTYAEGLSLDRMKVSFNQDEEGNTSPDIYMPYYWNDSFFSALAYKSLFITTSEFSDDINTLETSSQKVFTLTVVQYESTEEHSGYSVGWVVENSNVQNNGLLSAPSAGASLNLLTDIEAISTGITGDVSALKLGNFFSLRTGGSLYPYSQLKVKHNLNEHSVESDASQDMTYKAFLLTYFESSFNIDLSLGANYTYESYNYTINQIDTITLKPAGTTEELDTSYKTLQLEAKLLFSGIEKNGLYPMVGYAYRTIDSNYGADSDKSEEDIFLFGLEKPF